MHDAPGIEKIAIVISENAAAGEAANISACLTAGLAAANSAWAGEPLRDADGFESVASSHLPIVVLAANGQRFTTLVEQIERTVRPAQALVTLFPAYTQSIHDAHAYWQKHSMLGHRSERFLGIGLAGPKRWVNRLVGSFPLMR